MCHYTVEGHISTKSKPYDFEFITPKDSRDRDCQVSNLELIESWNLMLGRDKYTGSDPEFKLEGL